MPPDPSDVRPWLEKAATDLSAATLVQGHASLSAVLCFHCQQAVEKALKGYLTFRQAPFEWSHDLDYLLDLCEPLDPLFEQFRDRAEALNDYAVLFRYPSVQPDPTAEQAGQALAAAREVFNFVLLRLPAETHPAG